MGRTRHECRERMAHSGIRCPGQGGSLAGLALRPLRAPHTPSCPGPISENGFHTARPLPGGWAGEAAGTRKETRVLRAGGGTAGLGMGGHGGPPGAPEGKPEAGRPRGQGLPTSPRPQAGGFCSRSLGCRPPMGVAGCTTRAEKMLAPGTQPLSPLICRHRHPLSCPLPTKGPAGQFHPRPGSRPPPPHLP